MERKNDYELFISGDERKKQMNFLFAGAIFFSILRSRKCGIIFTLFLTFMLISTMAFM